MDVITYPCWDYIKSVLVKGAPIVYFTCVYWHTSNTYRKTSNISCTLVGNKIVDTSDVVGASPVGAAPTTSSFST